MTDVFYILDGVAGAIGWVVLIASLVLLLIGVYLWVCARIVTGGGFLLTLVRRLVEGDMRGPHD